MEQSTKPDGSLDEWIVSHYQSDAYAELTRSMDPRDLRLPPTEAAMIVSLIDRLKPEVALEIGTFFGQTALQMAEAIAKNGKGKLITIDPFGEARVPGIIKTWPAEAQAVTEFQPAYSMQFFATLEAKMTRGGYTPLGVVFVDGNHAFEYALYDILSAAANVAPGGADHRRQHGTTRSQAGRFRIHAHKSRMEVLP